jgi:hypothetical protein
MRDADCGIEESRGSHSPIRDPQSAILIRSSRSASSGRARHCGDDEGITSERRPQLVEHERLPRGAAPSVPFGAATRQP